MGHAVYMQRCFQLARLADSRTSPNPLVGAVLVHAGRIIGEGYHQRHGGPHAEVQALAAVQLKDRDLIPKSTLYVSLEPCCITGRTPPCTNLIIEHGIPNVVISCLDYTPEVSGRGVQILRDAGVNVTTNVLAEAGLYLSRFRRTFTQHNRPHILLKYAVSADGYVGRADKSVWLSHPVAKRYVHRLRATYSAILVGRNTAELDDPELTTRLYFGPSPLRIVLDRKARLRADLKLFQETASTWWVTETEQPTPAKPVHSVPISFDENLLPHLLDRLYVAGRSSLLVEGGALTLQRFVQAGLWDEAIVIRTPVRLDTGVPAPALPVPPTRRTLLLDNRLEHYVNPEFNPT